MKIVSKFRDYYDGVQGMYRDDNSGNSWPLYVRKTEHKEYDGPIYGKGYHQQEIYANKIKYTYDPLIVGFCGKLYYGIRLTEWKPTGGVCPDKFYYDMDELHKVLNLHQDNKSWLKEYDKNNGSWGWLRKPIDFRKKRDELLESAKRCLKFFVEHNIPEFVIDSSYDKAERLIINAELKQYEFYKCMDSYTSFQELDMFLGNDLAHSNDPSMPVGSDKVIAESKGFNKFSFRKDKSKKRK